MYHIQLKPNAQPVHHPPRAVPEKKKSAYKDELERLCSSGIVEPVQGHTDWANSVAPVSKHDGSIRLCLDPMDINRSIKRNQYYTKTIDEVSAEPLGGKYFTVTDVKSGYWMVELDNESSLLTTFNTLWASDFPLVVKSAQTYFSRGYINAVPKKVKEIMGCIDDIITRGVDSKDHDVNLLQLLETARMNGIKLNPKKLQFKTTKCFFFGQTITLEGMKINYKKPEAIKQMKAPKDKKALQSFQWMVNYLKRYSAKLTRLFEPLKPLLREEMEWTWDFYHQRGLRCHQRRDWSILIQPWTGWPPQRQQLSEWLQHYWNYREELAVEDGLVFKADWLVVLTSLKAEYLKDLHAGHLEEEKNSVEGTRDSLLAGLTDVRNAVKLCDVWMEYKPAQQKEPLVL